MSDKNILDKKPRFHESKSFWAILILTIFATLCVISTLVIQIGSIWLWQDRLNDNTDRNSSSHQMGFLLIISNSSSIIASLFSILAILKIAREGHYLKRFIAYVNWNKNWLYIILLLIALFGGGSDYIIPLMIPTPFKDGDTVPALRQAILVTVAGLLTMLTLWENRRKNLQEKDKNDLDHIRQVKSERRSRYAKAIEQLGDDNTSIKLGGIYTLSKLIDEWLEDDKTTPIPEERIQEGQIIINNLCAYIRSPFEHTSSYEILTKQNPSDDELKNYNKEEEFYENRAKLRGEQEIRKAILLEIKSKLSSKTTKTGEHEGILQKGLWSDFSYDFSHALIFYPFDISEGFLCSDAKFSGTIFLEEAKFNGIRFKNDSIFNNSEFHNVASFANAIFEKDAFFQKVTFKDIADFWNTKFKGLANFNRAHFDSDKGISTTEYHPTHSLYQKFKSSADFRKANFEKMAKFCGSTFSGSADFRETVFMVKPIFKFSERFKKPAMFSHKAKEEDYIFDNLGEGSCEIDLEVKIYKEPSISFKGKPTPPREKKFNIPRGCALFDPSYPPTPSSSVIPQAP